jgi:hypothetical protein
MILMSIYIEWNCSREPAVGYTAIIRLRTCRKVWKQEDEKAEA